MEAGHPTRTAPLQMVHLLLEVQVWISEHNVWLGCKDYLGRNDMETVGVKAGCTLQLFSDSSFNHYTVGIEARHSDRCVGTA